MSIAILMELLNLFCGYNGDKSAPSNVSGTYGSFNVKGNGSIKVRGSVNSGYCAGNRSGPRFDPPNHPESPGTVYLFKVDNDEIEIDQDVNSGAFSGNEIVGDDSGAFTGNLTGGR